MGGLNGELALKGLGWEGWGEVGLGLGREWFRERLGCGVKVGGFRLEGLGWKGLGRGWGGVRKGVIQGEVGVRG